MKQNPYDVILDRIKQRIDSVVAEIDRRAKGVPPFDKERIKPYSQWTPEYVDYLRITIGEDVALKIAMEEEARRGYYG